jgi:hypothetical protein
LQKIDWLAAEFKLPLSLQPLEEGLGGTCQILAEGLMDAGTD